MKRRVSLWLGAVVASLAGIAPAGAAAQGGQQGGQAPLTVETVGTSDVALDRRLERLLGADPLILTSDTRIRAEDTIPRSVLVLDATVIHEGTILGDLVLVDAGVFVRHEAVVRGDLVNIGGGLYRSELARIGGTIIDLPDAGYRVIREPGRIIIEASGTPVRLSLDGFGGLRTPTYDRANGLGVAWGAAYRLPRLLDATPTVRAGGGWRTEAGPMYGASFDLRSGALTVAVGHERTGDTHDDWAWGDLRNSLNYLWDGDDFRNYYEARRSWAAVEREFGDASKSFFGYVRLAGRIEDAESLVGGDPWHLTGEPARPNPSIDAGRITSASARSEVEWHGRETDLVARVEYEAGRVWGGGQFVFDRVTAGVRFAMHGLLDHTLEIRAFGQIPLASNTLPRQRWTVVGGPGTLQTVPVGTYRGDHVLFVESRYRLPAPEAVALPILGAPEVQLVHAAGMAWLADHDGTLVQEVGGRLQFLGLYVQYMLQPSDPGLDGLVVGLTWPFGPRFPWER